MQARRSKRAAAVAYDAVRHSGPECNLRWRLVAAPRSVVPILRAASGQVSERISIRIQQEIEPYAGAPHSSRGRFIRAAVERAVSDFIDLAANKVDGHAAVDEIFREMGYAEGAAGMSLTPLQAAIHTASTDVWQTLHRVAQQHDFAGGTVITLGERLGGYLQHLSDQAERGYLAARAAATSPRARLVTSLLTGGPGAESITELARASGWVLPQRAIVLAADIGGQPRPPSLTGFPGRLLVRSSGDTLTVIAEEADETAALEEIRRVICSAPVAVSWAVSLSEVAHAHRWARRALRLHREGRVRASQQVINCADYRVPLLLEADPPLLEQVGAELLEPLATLKPHYRLVLAETLLRLLETDENAPALARRLDVHPQTVRHRIRALRDLFGQRLHEPEQRMALILVLEATVPRWRAEQARR